MVDKRDPLYRLTDNFNGEIMTMTLDQMTRYVKAKMIFKTAGSYQGRFTAERITDGKRYQMGVEVEVKATVTYRDISE